VTRDLKSFWATGYRAVKADLKGQYPRHYWPDDPLVAEPTAWAKPRPGLGGWFVGGRRLV
jgi:ATP-dependent helicase HrpB